MEPLVKASYKLAVTNLVQILPTALDKGVVYTSRLAERTLIEKSLQTGTPEIAGYFDLEITRKYQAIDSAFRKLVIAGLAKVSKGPGTKGKPNTTGFELV